MLANVKMLGGRGQLSFSVQCRVKVWWCGRGWNRVGCGVTAGLGEAGWVWNHRWAWWDRVECGIAGGLGEAGWDVESQVGLVRQGGMWNCRWAWWGRVGCGITGGLGETGWDVELQVGLVRQGGMRNCRWAWWGKVGCGITGGLGEARWDVESQVGLVRQGGMWGCRWAWWGRVGCRVESQVDLVTQARQGGVDNAKVEQESRLGTVWHAKVAVTGQVHVGCHMTVWGGVGLSSVGWRQVISEAEAGQCCGREGACIWFCLPKRWPGNFLVLLLLGKNSCQTNHSQWTNHE